MSRKTTALLFGLITGLLWAVCWGALTLGPLFSIRSFTLERLNTEKWIECIVLSGVGGVVFGAGMAWRWVLHPPRRGRTSPSDLAEGETVIYDGSARLVRRFLHLDAVTGWLWITDRRLCFRPRFCFWISARSYPLPSLISVELFPVLLLLSRWGIRLRTSDWHNDSFLLTGFERDQWKAALAEAGIRVEETA